MAMITVTMNIAKFLGCIFLLTAVISFAGCTKPFYPMQPFPDHKAAACTTLYEPPPMLSVTNIQCPDKLITADVQNYIQSNHLMPSIIFIYFRDDKTGWRAVQITELKEVTPQRTCVEHLLEYDKSGARTKTRRVPWHWHSF